MSQSNPVAGAVITASASVLVAVVLFVLNQRNQGRQEIRQIRLARVNSQLRDLYGPLNFLVSVNEQLWSSLRENQMPAQQHRSPQAGDQDWRRWRDSALMPVNRRMRDLIVEHADLLNEDEVPPPLQDFCAHVASLEVVLIREADGLVGPPLVRHPGRAYVEYVEKAFAELKRDQLRLTRMIDGESS